MHVLQILDALLFIMYVEVIITALSELRIPNRLQLSRGLLFQHLQGDGQGRNRRLSQEQVNMLGHQHISGDHKPIAESHLFKLTLEEPVSCGVAQQKSRSFGSAYPTDDETVRGAPDALRSG